MSNVKAYDRFRLGSLEHVQEHDRNTSQRFSHSAPKGNETPQRTPAQHQRMLERFGKR